MTSDHMQVRIIALEVLIRGFMVDAAMKASDPIDHLQKWRDDSVAFVNGLAPKDDQTQKIISEAARALSTTFEQAEKRLRHIRSE